MSHSEGFWFNKIKKHEQKTEIKTKMKPTKKTSFEIYKNYN